MPVAGGNGLELPEATAGGHHDEAGEIIGFAAEAIVDPRTHCGATGNGSARVHEGVGRVVVDGFGFEGVYNANLIGHFANERENFGNHLARLAERFELVLRGEAGEFLPLQLGNGLPFRERFGHRLAPHLCQFGLVIECFEMARSAGLAEEDNPFGFGGDVQLREFSHASLGMTPQDAGQGRGANSHGSMLQKCAACIAEADELGEVHGWSSGMC